MSSERSVAKTVWTTIGIFVGVFVLVFVLLVIFVRKDVHDSDLQIEYSPNITSIAYDIDITAKCNIIDLELSYTFYNDNDEKAQVINKYIGDLDRGENKTVSIKLTDMRTLPKRAVVSIVSGKKTILSYFF